MRRRLSLIIQLDGTCPSPHGDPDWLREEKMLNAAKIIVNNTAGRNWERQHAARRLVEGRINVERGEDYC